MPRKPDPLRAQIKALEALVRADKAERRVAEAPLRGERRALTERLRSLQRILANATKRRAEMMLLGGWQDVDERTAEYIHGQRWRDAVARITAVTAKLATTEQALAAFNQLHPELP